MSCVLTQSLSIFIIRPQELKYCHLKLVSSYVLPIHQKRGGNATILIGLNFHLHCIVHTNSTSKKLQNIAQKKSKHTNTSHRPILTENVNFKWPFRGYHSMNFNEWIEPITTTFTYMYMYVTHMLSIFLYCPDIWC